MKDFIFILRRQRGETEGEIFPFASSQPLQPQEQARVSSGLPHECRAPNTWSGIEAAAIPANDHRGCLWQSRPWLYLLCQSQPINAPFNRLFLRM